MRTFSVPAPIGAIKFSDLATWLLDYDSRFAASSGMRAAVRIDAALRLSLTTGTIALENDDWLLLKTVGANVDPLLLARSDADLPSKTIALGLLLGNRIGPWAAAINGAVLT